MKEFEDKTFDGDLENVTIEEQDGSSTQEPKHVFVPPTLTKHGNFSEVTKFGDPMIFSP